MRRVAVLVALLGAVAFAAPAASQHPDEHGSDGAQPATRIVHRATIGFDNVSPQRLDLVAGEAVTWTNESSRTHTVTADDGSFDSGRVLSSDTYSRRFAATGEAPYHCELHPGIRGVVAVHDLLLDAPGQAAAPKRPFSLSGRAALPGGTPVSIEGDSGAGFKPVASGEIGDDGRFAARFVPASSMTLRAVAGAVTSPSVNLLVLDRRVSLTVRRLAHGNFRLRATVTPASRGGRLVLQTFLPERFGWWPVRRATVGRSSAATFTIHSHRRLRARVRYTLADGATTLATSRVVHIGPPRARHRR